MAKESRFLDKSALYHVLSYQETDDGSRTDFQITSSRPLFHGSGDITKNLTPGMAWVIKWTITLTGDERGEGL